MTRVTPHAAFVDVGARVPAYLHVADIGLPAAAQGRRRARAAAQARGAGAEYSVRGSAVDVGRVGCG